MARGGTPNETAEPQRRCIVSGETGPKNGLIRFVVGPDHSVVPDILDRLPGRGIWVSSERKALETAVAKNSFAKAARQKVSTAPDLAEQVEAQLARRVVELVAMTRKAGLAVAGYEKVKGWIESGQAKLLLQAHDGSGRGRSKIKPPEGAGTLVTVLNAAELGIAFGRENVIHAALAGGGLTIRVVEEAARLSGLRATNDGETPVGKGKTTI
ncbi:MAG: RNA-binding protein [Pseudomonadota bacterium]